MASVREVRPGVWRVVVSNPGVKDAVGRYERAVRMVHGRKRDAEDVAAELRDRFNKGTFARAGELRVDDFFDDFLSRVRATRGEGRTWAGYRDVLRRHWRGPLGKMLLRSVMASHVQKVEDDLLAKGLGRATVHQAHRVASRAFRLAVKQKLLAVNPFDAVEPPRPGKRSHTTPNAEEVSRLLAAAESSRFSTLYLLLATTGLRRGEACGLRWRDVELDGESPVLRVTQALIKVDGQVWAGPAKTDGSSRTVALSTRAVVALRAHHRAQAEARLRAGEDWQDLGLVFCGPNGAFLDPDVVSIAWMNVRKRAGLLQVRLHDLRHAFATLALQANVHPKVVSEALGHSNIRITLDTYSAVLPSMSGLAVAAVDAALGPEPE